MKVENPIHYSIYQSVKDIDPEIWNPLNHEDKTCLGIPYLQAQEEAPPPGMKFFYGVFTWKERPAGIAVFQLLPLRQYMIRKNIRKKRVLKSPGKGFYLLICGNALLSGEYGYAHLPFIDSGNFITSLDRAIKEIRSMLPHYTHILSTLIKDTLPQSPACPAIFGQRYYGFSLSPNLIIKDLDRFSDYSEFKKSMKGKYRRNLESGEKRGTELIRKELTVGEIRANRLRIYDLYFQVHQKARFRICTLHPQFFEKLKERLPGKFTLTAYHHKGEMVAFTTRILSHYGNVMEGYSHGLQQKINKDFALYQNILLDDIKTAIDLGIPRINMGRTSIGMKSALGAVPEPMFVFARINKPFVEGVLLPHIEAILPEPEPCRRPFAQ